MYNVNTTAGALRNGLAASLTPSSSAAIPTTISTAMVWLLV